MKRRKDREEREGYTWKRREGRRRRGDMLTKGRDRRKE